MKDIPEFLGDLERQVSEAVMESAACLVEAWQQNKEVRFKQGADPVTKFDSRIEDELRQRLGDLLPEAGFIVEEGESIKASGNNWVIDPIDQTKNFVGQIPIFCVQVALVKDDTPILGVIYNPVSHQLLSASRGNGARLNGGKPPVSSKKQLSESIVDIDFGDNSQLAWKLQSLENVAKAAFRVRVSGGAYAAYLLTGGIDAFLVVNEKTKPFDQLPRIIMAREAGLLFEEYDIQGHRVLIAGQPNIVQEIRDCIDV